MKRIKWVYLFTLALAIYCCSPDDSEGLYLKEQYDGLLALSLSVDCIDSSEWRFAGIGAKPCGGPSGYIAYSKDIDTVYFLDRLSRYNKAVREKNLREDLFSDCSIVPAPSAIRCENKKPILVYRK